MTTPLWAWTLPLSGCVVPSRLVKLGFMLLLVYIGLRHGISLLRFYNDGGIWQYALVGYRFPSIYPGSLERSLYSWARYGSVG